MSEKILKALLQLFAIVARPEQDESEGATVVEAFLKQQLNQELVQEYLKIFQKYYKLHQKRYSEKAKQKKRFSSSSVRVLKICAAINEELTQKQKIIVIIRLLEFIDIGSEITEQALEFVATVAESFHISQREYNDIQSFVHDPFSFDVHSEHLLLIDRNSDSSDTEFKHLQNTGLEGQIRILHIVSVSLFVLRYMGNDEIYLNNQLLQADKIRILTVGSSIKSSKITPIYYSDIIAAFHLGKISSNIVIEAVNLSYKFKNGETGLHTMNFLERSGKLTGLMGASGTGKSTLVNVLNGSFKPTTGEVLINGINIHNEKKRIEGVIGYVSQDDLLIEELTVYQNLYFNAKLCFDNYSEFKIIRTVLRLLNNLGLFEIKDMKVGSPLNKRISGGQRKRLNIALELIREPAVLFLDEPTSGLSSRDSENIMDLLKELTLKGKLVFVVIHQPSSNIFKMFDQLLILDQGGYLIYNGDPVDSIIYFKSRSQLANWNESECHVCGNVNPEQIFNIVESQVIDEYGNLTKTRKITPKEWYKYFTEFSKKSKKKVVMVRELPEFSFKIPKKIKQFRVFVRRDVISKLTNRQYLLINLLEAPILAFLLSYIIKFYNIDATTESEYVFMENSNLPVYLFMSVIVALFIGLTVSAQEIIKDRKILKRESFLNLSWSGYLLSKIAIVFILSALQALIFILIGNSILEIKDMYFQYWLVLFSTWCFGNLLGLNISDGFKTSVNIYIVIPFLIIPQIILSGVLVNFDKLNPSISSPNNIPFYGEIMTARWAYEALAVEQFKNNEYEKPLYENEKKMSIAQYKKNYWLKKLENKLNFIARNYDKKNKKEAVERDLLILQNEIPHELQINKNVPISNFVIDNLYQHHLSDSLFAALNKYFEQLNEYYINMYNTTNKKHDRLINALQSSYILNDASFKKLQHYQLPKSTIKKLHTIKDTSYTTRYDFKLALKKLLHDDEYKKHGTSILKSAYKYITQQAKQLFLQHKKDYHNEQLAEFVKNSNELDRIVEYNGRLYQKTDPIYQDPSGNLLKSHFYSPRKRLFGIYIDTFYMNIIIIWIFTISLYITLYFRALRRLLDFGEYLANKFSKNND